MSLLPSVQVSTIHECYYFTVLEALLITMFLFAAPTALQTHRVCFGKSLTSYPSFKEEFEKAGNYKYKEDTVVVDGKNCSPQGEAMPYWGIL